MPYRWPDLIARPDDDVYFCEGEKDADRLSDIGLLATTVAGQNWSEVAADALSGRNVIIMEDNDEKGRVNSRKAVEALEARARSIRVVRLPGLKYKGDVSDWLDLGNTKDELLMHVVAARPSGARSEPYQFPDEKEIATWDWLYGKHILRRSVCATVAMSGTGKSSEAVAEALAMTSGKSFLGEAVRRPLRVLLINLEDDRNTMDKRIVAAMRLHELNRADVGDRLFVIAKNERKLKLARTGNSGQLEINDRDVAWLIGYLLKHKIDVLSVDPLIMTHGVNENDNEKIRAVIEIYNDVAMQANCGINLWHHTRKGNGGDVTVDSVRGAGALVDACRSVRILETMTRTEAEAAGIEPRDHRFYFKEFSGKLNFSPPLDQVRWFRLHNMELDNGGGLFGDEVGAVSTWTYPGIKEADLNPVQIAEIKRLVSSSSWRDDVRAAMWVGKAIGQILGLSNNKRIEAIKKELLERGILKQVLGKDEKSNDRYFVTVGDDPASHSPVRPTGEGSEDPG